MVVGQCTTTVELTVSKAVLHHVCCCVYLQSYFLIRKSLTVSFNIQSTYEYFIETVFISTTPNLS